MGKFKFILVLLGMAFGFASYAQSSAEFPSYVSNGLSIENRIHMYPNPSVEFLVVSIEESTLVEPQLIVHNIIGSIIEVNYSKTNPDEYTVDVANLPAGYYLLAIKDESTGFSETYKFLKR